MHMQKKKKKVVILLFFITFSSLTVIFFLLYRMSLLFTLCRKIKVDIAFLNANFLHAESTLTLTLGTLFYHCCKFAELKVV